MNILSFFVIIPLVMLPGLWVFAQHCSGERGNGSWFYCLAGTCSLAYVGLYRLEIRVQQMRCFLLIVCFMVCSSAYLLFCGSGWNIGCDAFTECCYCFYRDVCFMEAETID